MSIRTGNGVLRGTVIGTPGIAAMGQHRGFLAAAYRTANGLWRWLPLVALMVVSWFAFAENAPSTLVFYSLGLVIGLLGIRMAFGRGDWRSYRAIFLGVFAFTVITSVVFHMGFINQNGVPFYGSKYFGDVEVDGADYYRWSLLASKLPVWDYGALQNIVSSRYYGYIYVGGLVTRIANSFAGSNPLNMRIINAMGVAAISVMIYAIGRRFGMSQKRSAAAAYLLGFYPVTIFVAALVQRDLLVAVIVLLSVLVFERVRVGQGSLFGAGALLLLMVILREFRFESVLPMLAIFVMALLWGVHQRSNRIRMGGLLVLVVLVGIFLGTIFAPSENAPAPDLEALIIERGMIRYTDRILRYNVAESQSVSARILSLPPPFAQIGRMAYGVILPLPIPDPDRFETTVKNSGAIFWYPLMPFALLGILRGLKDPAKATFAIAGISYFVGVSLTTLADRHAMQYIPLFLLFGVSTAFQEKQRFRQWLVLLSVVLSLSFVAYTVLKMR